MRTVAGLLGVVAVLCAFGCATAEPNVATVRLGVPPTEPPSARRGPNVPTGYVIETKTAPTIDGVVNEAVWDQAAPLTLGTMNGRGKPKTETQVLLLHDGDYVYVAYRMEEPKVEKLRRKVTERDGAAYGDDDIEIFISKRGDDRFYQFVVGAGGALLDAYRRNKGWNCQAKHAVHIGKDAWSVELAIPLKAVGGVPPKRRPWRVNFYHARRTEGWEPSAWSPPMNGGFDAPNRFGILVFGDPPEPKGLPKTTAPGRPEILEVKNGEAVVRFDLGALPKGAEVRRAELLVFRRVRITGADKEALDPIEIYPLFSAFKDGDAGKAEAEPLRLRPPTWRSFDATDAVRQWARGKPNGGFFIKTCPMLDPATTTLDIAYAGAPKQVPPQVRNLKAFHRSGQTFLTWSEVDPLIQAEKTTWGEIKRVLKEHRRAVRYRVYASGRRITPATLGGAERVGEVGPLSAYNVNRRNKEYLIGEAMRQPDEIGELARNYNGYMHTWNVNSTRMDRYPVQRFVIDEAAGPLPVGTGLYVHHPAKAGRRYYAVVSVLDGVENTRDVGDANATETPVAETVGTGVPVRQGKGLWGPFFDYPGTRWVYVQWCAPPLAPRPNMYFNWSVLIPPNTGDPKKPVIPGMEPRRKVPAELYFHSAGYSHAQPGKKLLWDSIQLATYDFPASGWYGFNDAYGTLKSFTQGTVSNHTQRRIIAFLEWARKTFPINENQVICTGADGAASLALNFPDTFAYVRITGFNKRGHVLDPKAYKRFARIWGPPLPEIKDDHGRTKWEWAYLDKLALEQEKDLPLFTCLGPSWGRKKGYAKGQGRFYQAMEKARQPLIAQWGWNGARNLGGVNRYTGVWRGLLITRDSAVPAFSNSTRNHDREQSGTAGGGYGWRDVKETADRFEIKVLGGHGSTFDLTPRRLSKFKVRPGEALEWKAVGLPGRRGEKGEPQGGTVKADEHGLVTLRKLEITPRSGGLHVTITRAK
jgi:hypothetical protein